MITQLISTKMCRKVGYKLFTSSGNRQQSAGVPPTKKTRSNCYLRMRLRDAAAPLGRTNKVIHAHSSIKFTFWTTGILRAASTPQQEMEEVLLWLVEARQERGISFSHWSNTRAHDIFFPTAAADQQAFFNNLFSARWIIEARAWLQFGIFRHKLE